MTTPDHVSLIRKSRGAILKFALIGLAVIALGAFLTWILTCPCERMPGGYLLGDVVEEPINDWTFANQVPLCQIQISGLLPHAINLNCMATAQGNLYLSCSACAPKYWSGQVQENSRSRIRLDGNVYPVNITRVTEQTEMDQAWQARIDKLQVVSGPGNPAVPVGTPRPDSWWTFRVQS
ncbi:MAG: hypothetical protein WD772_07815, partial [Pseudohongiellaceae bacterium]